MKTTTINVEKVMTAGTHAKQAADTVRRVRTGIETVKKSLASDVLSRSNNRQNLDKIISSLEAAEKTISKIKTTAENGANAYYSTDVRIQNSESSISSTGRRLTNGNNDSAFRG